MSEGFALGDTGVLAIARPGSLYIDMSTVRPATAVALAVAGRARGVGVLDAPVSGGERGAIDGTLSIMVGGEQEDVAAARPVLEAIGATIVHVGAAGAGQTVKAANQLLTAVTIQAVAEAVVFLEAHGVDPTVGDRAPSPAVSRAAPCSTDGRRRWCDATSRRASAAHCTIRTWASSPRPPATPV